MTDADICYKELRRLVSVSVRGFQLRCALGSDAQPALANSRGCDEGGEALGAYRIHTRAWGKINNIISLERIVASGGQL